LPTTEAVARAAVVTAARDDRERYERLATPTRISRTTIEMRDTEAAYPTIPRSDTV
jgi:hypothetical protein